VIAGVHAVTGSEDDPRHVAILAVADPVGSAAEAKRLYDAVPLEAVSDANALRLWGMAAHAVSDPPAAIDFLSRAEMRLREQGRLAMLSHAVTMQIVNHLELGSWDRAVSAAEEGLRLAQESGQPVWDIGTHTLTAIVDGMRGDRVRAESIAGEAEIAANGQRLSDLLACVQLARGFAALTGGDPSIAMDELLKTFDPADLAYHATERFHGVAYLVEAAVHSGRVDELRPVLERLRADAAITPSTTLRVHLAYADAVMADDDSAEALFRMALADDLMRWPLARARLELAYGSWLRRHRRVGESRGPLRSAASTFTAIGADWWADQARTELRAAGERLPDQTNSIESLSAQELQIARLAADGLTNREIGARLFLSPRTVGFHLYRIFPKLGITSRAQLASRLRM
jgi:DNA-binding CsgD family transcriptional regulator